MIEDSNFVFNYVPITYTANKLEVSTDKIILEAMIGTISLYFVNQSVKVLAYAPLEYLKGWAKFKHILRTGYKTELFSKGNMIELKTVHALDFLAKGVLTEKDGFFIHPDGGYYLVHSINPIFRYLHANFLINKFHSITLDQVFILRSDLAELKESLTAPKQLDEDEVEDNQSGALTRQEQRELIFFEWLTDKNEHTVSQMKKEEVLAELRKINPHLFMGDQKHFFRLQKRITFKSGRKAENDD